MDDKQILLDALKFHGHKCWASVAGVRVGLAALRTLDVKRSGGTQLHGIAARVSYKPTLQKQIAESAFMQKRGMGMPPYSYSDRH